MDRKMYSGKLFGGPFHNREVTVEKDTPKLLIPMTAEFDDMPTWNNVPYPYIPHFKKAIYERKTDEDWVGYMFVGIEE